VLKSSLRRRFYVAAAEICVISGYKSVLKRIDYCFGEEFFVSMDEN
jgi:hypothetical protein